MRLQLRSDLVSTVLLILPSSCVSLRLLLFMRKFVCGLNFCFVCVAAACGLIAEREANILLISPFTIIYVSF